MDNNYLWNRSGEPDREVQELEELLGTLRYQPQPLEIPANTRIGRRRSYFPAIAIAASLILFAVAIALLINFNRRRVVDVVRDPQIEQRNTPQPKATVPDKPLQAGINDPPKTAPEPRRHRAPNKSLIAQNKTVTRKPALTPQELAEKEQVLLALRLVSAKLNFAQRKLQGAPPPNTVRNQHKIG